MKNTVTYIFNWDNTAEVGLGSKIASRIMEKLDELKLLVPTHSRWMSAGRFKVTLFMYHVNDFARLAEFDEFVNEVSKDWTDYGFEWEERNSKLRQPRTILVDGTTLYTTTDVVATVTRQRQQKVQMGYFNQSAGVRYVIEVTDWVLVGEMNHVHWMASRLREELREKWATDSDAVSRFITRQKRNLDTDQLQVYGMNKDGVMSPVIAPRDPYKVNIERLNEYLVARNFQPLSKAEFN